MTATVLRKEKQSLTQEFSSSHNLIQNHKERSTENWLKDQTVFCKNFPAHLFASKSLLSWGGISRVYSQKSNLDAKEFCKLSLFYYLTWWWTELKSTMTKENESLCITLGKEKGINCQTDSPNASGLVILKLLPGPETDPPPPTHPSQHLVSRGSQLECIFLISKVTAEVERINPPYSISQQQIWWQISFLQIVYAIHTTQINQNQSEVY